MNRPAILSTLVSVFALGTAGASLLTNGDFEAGTTLPANGFSTSYTLGSPSAVAGNYNIVTEFPAWAPGLGDHTSGSGNFAIFNGSTNSNDVMLAQSVSLTSGVAYTFSGWVANLTEDAVMGAPPTMEVRVDGVSVGSEVGPTVDDTWTQFTISWVATATGTFSVALHDASTVSEGNDFGIDDVSLTVVPEASEAVIALLGLGGLLGHRRRRR